MQAEADKMNTDDAVPTQHQSQSTQEAPPSEPVDDSQLWGYLIPCRNNLRRIDFYKNKHVYSIGRNREGLKNDIILPGMKISNFHCQLEWDGDETPKSAVKVTDLSSNGTWINGEIIGKGRFSVLRDGNELAFACANPQPNNSGLEDYRFVFRHIASGPPSRGLHKFYDLQHELGKGNFATVMKALHKEEGKWYAVKIIQANKLRRNLSNRSANSPITYKETKENKFAREIDILERLRHPNVCQLKEVFFEHYNINIVLEWVPGGDLLEHILKKGGLEEAECQYLTYQMCDALAYVHSLGITHRDLKPENILLTADEPPILKVADFGLAKVVDSLTMLRTQCGTPAYLAPEVVMHTQEEGYGQVVDSWSVGIIVYSMITMSNPFGVEDEAQEIEARVAMREIDWEFLDRHNISDVGIDFIHCLLEKNARERMTLANARTHPWLIRQHHTRGPQVPYHVVPAIADARPRAASPGLDAPLGGSMASVIADMMELDDYMDADQDGRRTPEFIPEDDEDDDGPLPRQSSRIRRRRDIINSAQAHGRELPSPSQEMRARAEAEEAEEEDEARAGPSRRNKRKAAQGFGASLKPMKEEEDEEEYEDEVVRVPVKTPASRRGRGGAKKADVPVGRRARRVAAHLSENENVLANVDGEIDAGRPRRSMRHTQNASPAKVKVARRG